MQHLLIYMFPSKSGVFLSIQDVQAFYIAESRFYATSEDPAIIA
jgi:hypothetical protein